MKNFGIVWLENKSLSSGTIEAEDPTKALELFKTTKNPAGSYPVTRTVTTEGRISRVVKNDGRCMAIVIDLS